MMNRILISLMTALLFFSVFIYGGLSQVTGNVGLEGLISQERMGTGEGRNFNSLPDSEDFRTFIIRTEETRERGTNRSDPWFSSDPEDFNPLLGTTWEFTYTISDTWTDELNFETQAEVYDGTAMLYYSDQYGVIGGTTYTEFSDSMGGGYGYLALTMGDILNFYYFFKLDGNTATGNRLPYRRGC